MKIDKEIIEQHIKTAFEERFGLFPTARFIKCFHCKKENPIYEEDLMFLDKIGNFVAEETTDLFLYFFSKIKEKEIRIALKYNKRHKNIKKEILAEIIDKSENEAVKILNDKIEELEKENKSLSDDINRRIDFDIANIDPKWFGYNGGTRV